MKYAFILTLGFLQAFSHTIVFAQSGETVISGRVVSADNFSPLEGAAIAVKGTKNLTGTMPDGAFSLPILNTDTVLLISLAGYESKEIRLGKEAYYEISLKHVTDPLNNISSVVFRKEYVGHTNLSYILP